MKHFHWSVLTKVFHTSRRGSGATYQVSPFTCDICFKHKTMSSCFEFGTATLFNVLALQQVDCGFMHILLNGLSVLMIAYLVKVC